MRCLVIGMLLICCIDQPLQSPLTACRACLRVCSIEQDVEMGSEGPFLNIPVRIACSTAEKAGAKLPVPKLQHYKQQSVSSFYSCLVVISPRAVLRPKYPTVFLDDVLRLYSKGMRLKITLGLNTVAPAHVFSRALSKVWYKSILRSIKQFILIFNLGRSFWGL